MITKLHKAIFIVIKDGLGRTDGQTDPHIETHLNKCQLISFVCSRLTNHVLSLWALSVFGLVLLNFPDGVPYLYEFSLFRIVFGKHFHYETYFVWVR